MRDDIVVLGADGRPLLDSRGRARISIQKAIGKNYNHGWFTNCHDRYRAFKGGRGTKKSYDMIGYEPVIKVVFCPYRNVVVLRQNDVDNRQSTFEQIVTAIDDLGFSESFDVHKNPLEIEYIPTGQKIIFRGMNNPTSLNSIKFKAGTFWTDSYFEEAYELISFDDFRKIDGSMRGQLPPGGFFQLTLCFNAWSQGSWIYPAFFKGNLEDDYNYLDSHAYEDWDDPKWQGPRGKGLYLHISTYRANEFLMADPEYEETAQATKLKAPEIYKVEWLGMWGNATAAVYPEFNKNLVHPIQDFIGFDQGREPKFPVYSYALGIDTGLSNGEGKKRTVKKGEKVENRVKSATVLTLCAVSQDLSKMAVIDEYFHSNDPAYNDVNTDNTDQMTQPQLVEKCLDVIEEWIDRYGGQDSGTILMKGQINVYVDSADVGFRQSIELAARQRGLFRVRFFASTKISVQSRVDFWRLMMAWGDYMVCDKCKNGIREIKNARRGEKGEAREDSDDHWLTSQEYALTPLLPDLRRWRTFKQR